MSHLTSTDPGVITNPFYGVDVPRAGSGHLRFLFAFWLFGKMTSLMAGNLWASMFVWNLLWLGLLSAIAIFVFERFLPDPSPELVSLALVILMFFNFGILKSFFLAWLHPSWPAFEELILPSIRPFYPQVAIPFLLAYFGLQIEWLRTRRPGWLAVMSLLQLIAFALFPYTTMMMAGITATVVVQEIFSRPQLARQLPMALYAIACGVADLAWFWHGAEPNADKGGGHPIIRLDLSVLHHVVGGMWMLIAILTLVSALVHTRLSEAKWPLIGLGLANLALLTGDLLFPESDVMLSHHGGYFVHTTVTVLILFLLATFYGRARERRPSLRSVIWLIALALAVNGLLIAVATYRRFVPDNQAEAQLVKLLQDLPVSSNDLLIVRAEVADDLCSWAPLVSPAKVLYCRNAAVLLTDNQTKGLQRFRQAFYLYLEGANVRGLDRVMSTPALLDKQLRLAFFGSAPSNEGERSDGLREARTDLLPYLEQVESHDAKSIDFLRGFTRLIVIDDRSHPLFEPERLRSYLTVQQESSWGEWSIEVCKAR